MSRQLLCAHNQLWLLTHFFVTEQIHPLEVLNSIAHGSLIAAANEAIHTNNAIRVPVALVVSA